MSILEEFKTFALRGNAVELAVGVVIGVAFNNIVNSLVEDIINPVIGALTGKVNLSDKVLNLKTGDFGLNNITLNYGQFIEATINFFLVAFVLFLVVRQMNKWSGKNKV
ncbi:MAG TPA: large conductance mechanosensitive channel protein MscL [Candidatus Paceibacterota bacterium]